MAETKFVIDEAGQDHNVINLQFSPSPPAAVERGRSERADRRDAARFFLVADVLLVLISALLATFLRSSVEHASQRFLSEIGIVKHFGFLAFYLGLLILCCHVYKVYRSREIRSRRDEQLAILKAAAMATVLVTACIYLSGAKTISRLVIGETVILSTLAMIGWRFLLRTGVIDGLDCRNVLIVSADPVGRDLERYFMRNRDLGFVVKGYLDRRQNGTRPYHPDRRRGPNDFKILGCARDLARVARSNFIDEIFITSAENRELVKRLIFEAKRAGIDTHLVPDLYDGLASAAHVEFLGDIPMMSVCQRSVPVVGLLIKRCIDILVATVALVVLAPAILLVALLVKLTSSGPVLYRSIRIGKKGRDFVCYKFRTMVANADELRDSLHHLNEREGILFKIANDPRITPIGRLLRKYSLDELPQLLNVLRGDMSLVGPRPGMPSEYEKYSIDHLRRLDVVPGITGLWQVAARRDPSFQSYIALDTQYVDDWSLWGDCRILWKTIAVVFAGTGQ